MTMRTRDNLLDLYPLTPVQEGILYHALSRDDDPYLLRVCFRIDGAIDLAALERAWQVVIDRHEALRADLEWTRSKQAVQRVFRRCPIAIEQLHWNDVPAEQIGARLRALAADEARRFSLQRAADQRVLLIHTAPARSYLMWIVHHALLDGWSIANAFAELLGAYRAAAGGPPAEMSPVPPYAAYLGWLRAQDAAQAEAYWRTVLADHEALAFPPPPPEAAAPAAGFAERSILFDADESAQLAALARSAQATLSTCFQGAIALLLRAYTGRDDVAFGATVAGRPSDLAGASAMIGAFINTVPVRVRLRGGDAVIPWLQRLHREAGQRRAFEHLSLSRIQELAALPAGQSLFESILVFENFPVSDALDRADALPFAVTQHRLADGDGDLVLGRGRNHYPVTFVVLPGARIELILAYHRDRLDDAAASHMLDRLGAIVRDLASAAPTTRLAAIGDRTGSYPIRERANLEADAIAAAQRAAPRAIHDWIAHWADTTPDAIAVRCEDEVLRYAELEARADRLAHALLARGVTPGAHVGLCLPRGTDFIVALYAALKAGAAYVPLDPEHPRSRLAGLVDDARLAALITRRASLSALDGLHPVLLAADAPGGAAGPRVCTAVHPESPAYLIYTSGSTGRPKGVIVSHRALDNYVTGILARMALPPGASMAMVSTVAADLGHTSLFGALCGGGTLHLIRDERATDPDGFADYMTRHRVDALKIVPGHLWGLMQIAEPDRALPAHTLVIGGEAAPPALLEHLRRQTRCRVINHYGPTETTVGILTHPVAPPADGDAPGAAAVPLGKPLPRTRAEVLGPDLLPVPPGVAGEIYLGGRGVATGYFRRPELTAERFVPDPRSAEPGARLYRTGDRGRVRGDGAIEFLGRADDQIKLRGFRIELGEIRAELVRLPGVSDARVVARPGPAGSPQLCAYLVTAAPATAPRDAELRAQLAARLPEPMIPSAFVWLDRFPVTANGKIDVARLPVPGAAAAGERPAAPPTTEPERLLAKIWGEILSRPAVGRDDNFFELGGDSILALKVVARTRRAGWKLTPKLLFANPTLAAAARTLLPIAPAPLPTGLAPYPAPARISSPTSATSAVSAANSTSTNSASANSASANSASANSASANSASANSASANPASANPAPVDGTPALDSAAAATSASRLAATEAPASVPVSAETSAPASVAEPARAATSAATQASTADSAFVPRAGEPALLTPIQLRFLERQTVDPQHYNQAILLALAAPIAPGTLERAVAQLTAHHEALRLRFRRDGDAWHAWYADPNPAGAADAAPRIDLRDAADPAAAIERACDELQRGFDLARGPLFRAAYLDLGPAREPRLLLVAHHLVVDGVSWRILLEDLATLLVGSGSSASIGASTAALPPPTTPLSHWTARLRDHSRSAAVLDQRAYWQRAIAPQATIAPSPASGDHARRGAVGDLAVVSAAPGAETIAGDHARRGANTVGDIAVVSGDLDAETTAALLSRAPRAYATRVNDVLLAAFALALCRRWRRPSLLVTVEGHGREDLFDGVDLSRTIGWFSTLYPVRLTPAADRGATIAGIRDHLRQIPDGGIGYGLLQHLAPGAPLAAAGDEPVVTFNYLGQFDQAFAGQRLFRIAPESHGQRRSPRSPRDAWFVVNAVVHDRVLSVDWEYSRALHDRSEVEPLLADYLAELRAVIRHCDDVVGAAR